MSGEKLNHFMDKEGFDQTCTFQSYDTLEETFQTKRTRRNFGISPEKIVELTIGSEGQSYYFFTKSEHEFLQAKKKLIKEGYFHGVDEGSQSAVTLFQRSNMTLLATPLLSDSSDYYLLLLKVRKIPSAITYAEDLLQFDSYEYLASFFGSQNIKSDLYYFSKNELKKCSVLYNGTKRQAVFIWGDEQNLNNLSYIIFSNGIPTMGAESNTALTGTTGWRFRSGIYTGMDLRDLVRINQADFEIYGNRSEFSFMVKPNSLGRIDFRTTAMMLSCDQCAENPVFDHNSVSAVAILKSNLPLKVHDVILYPRK